MLSEQPSRARVHACRRRFGSHAWNDLTRWVAGLVDDVPGQDGRVCAVGAAVEDVDPHQHLREHVSVIIFDLAAPVRMFSITSTMALPHAASNEAACLCKREYCCQTLNTRTRSQLRAEHTASRCET